MAYPANAWTRAGFPARLRQVMIVSPHAMVLDPFLQLEMTQNSWSRVAHTKEASAHSPEPQNGHRHPWHTNHLVRNDKATDMDIQGTGQTYTLTSDYQGNTVKMSVGFTDAEATAEHND